MKTSTGLFVLMVSASLAGVAAARTEAGMDRNQSGPDPIAEPLPCGKIAFVSDRDGNREIYSVDADGTALERLTNDPNSDDEPAWSPDGHRIAFVSNRNGSNQIHVMNADGSGVRQLTAPGSVWGSWGPSWSPDGTKIAYWTLSNGSVNLWVVDADPSRERRPTLLFGAPSWDAQPSWSPHGQRLAFASDWNAYDLVYDIFLINSDGSGFTALTGDLFDNIDYLSPSWSPSADRLAVVITNRVGILDYITTVGVMNSDGSGLTPLFPGQMGPHPTAGAIRMSWSPDGERIAFTPTWTGSRDMFWVMADGSATGLIVSNGWDPSWRP